MHLIAALRFVFAWFSFRKCFHCFYLLLASTSCHVSRAPPLTFPRAPPFLAKAAAGGGGMFQLDCCLLLIDGLLIDGRSLMVDLLEHVFPPIDWQDFLLLFYFFTFYGATKKCASCTYYYLSRESILVVVV